LTASAVLMPLAPLSTIAGAWLVRRMRPETFYPFTYATVAVVALKLLWDGIVGLM
ncbi:sulfite exporter TauE/SafE family protein, partial [Mesorhizobium sp. M7A.F.Ca.US.007.01.1.1]